MNAKRLLRGPFIWVTLLLLVTFTLMSSLTADAEPEELSLS